ncbi:MAG: glycosyltransferase [Thermoleophilaceae bacterium]
MPDRVALFVSYSSALGGAERILLDVASGVADARLACPPGPLADSARAVGLQAIPMRPRSLELRRTPRDRVLAAARIAGLAREVREIVHERPAEIVVAWNMRALLACVPALVRLSNRPRLVFQHNDLLPGRAIGLVVGQAARRADLTICLSEAIARDLDPAGRLRRVEVAHAGVDLMRFAPSEAAPGPGSAVLVLGAIERWKRPDLALEIAARLPELRLRLAGEPIGTDGHALLAELRARAAESDLAGRVELCGRLDDPVPALRQAAALLHCADREPYGLALVEALACGLPVVAPAAGGPIEIVGDGGRLYPPGDAGAAATALGDVLERRGSLSTAARARAEARFDRQSARRRYAELLATV